MNATVQVNPPRPRVTIPLLHDVADGRVLVFGAGPVGARKARRFAREAALDAISPTFADEDFGTVERVRATPGPEAVGDWIDQVGPGLVVAATDGAAINAAINAAIERAARERGLLTGGLGAGVDRGRRNRRHPARVEGRPA